MVRNFSRATRRLAAAVATTVASVAVSLLVLEAGVRVWDGVPLSSIDNFVARELNSQVNPKNLVTQYDSQLGWVHAPNLHGGGFVTGAYGARMPGLEIVPLQSGAVLVVGDSFAAGSEVDDPDTWPARLERVTGTPVINAAVGGYGIDQIVLRAETLLPVLRPRVLLVQTRLGFGLVGARVSIYAGAPKPYFVIRDDKLVRNNDPVPRGNVAREDIGWLRSVLGYSYLVQFAMTRLDLVQWWDAPALAVTKMANSSDEAVDVTCHLMRRLADLRDRSNVRIDLVLQYAGTEGIEPTLAWEADHARIVGCAEREALEVIDTLDALRSAYRAGDLASYQRLWVMHDHDRLYGHMSPEGNELIANVIAQRLASDKTDAATGIAGNRRGDIIPVHTEAQEADTRTREK
jgi:hypothetical protein